MERLILNKLLEWENSPQVCFSLASEYREYSNHHNESACQKKPRRVFRAGLQIKSKKKAIPGCKNQASPIFLVALLYGSHICFYYPMGSKSAAPCLHRGQMMSSGSSSPS